MVLDSYFAVACVILIAALVCVIAVAVNELRRKDQLRAEFAAEAIEIVAELENKLSRPHSQDVTGPEPYIRK